MKLGPHVAIEAKEAREYLGFTYTQNVLTGSNETVPFFRPADVSEDPSSQPQPMYLYADNMVLKCQRIQMAMFNNILCKYK